MKFKCRKCGYCCSNLSDRGSREKGLPIFEWEVKSLLRLARKNKISLDIRPIDLLLDRKSGIYFCTGYYLANEPCVFLKDNKCLIYKHRPIVCRAFPIAKSPGMIKSVPDLSCFSKCPNFNFKDFLMNSLGLIEGRPYSLSREKLLGEYEKTFNNEILNCSAKRDCALAYFEEIMRILTEKKLIDVKKVSKSQWKLHKPLPFFLFLVKRGFIKEKDRKEIIKRFKCP